MKTKTLGVKDQMIAALQRRIKFKKKTLIGIKRENRETENAYAKRIAVDEIQLKALKK